MAKSKSRSVAISIAEMAARRALDEVLVKNMYDTKYEGIDYETITDDVQAFLDSNKRFTMQDLNELSVAGVKYNETMKQLQDEGIWTDEVRKDYGRVISLKDLLRDDTEFSRIQNQLMKQSIDYINDANKIHMEKFGVNLWDRVILFSSPKAVAFNMELPNGETALGISIGQLKETVLGIIGTKEDGKVSVRNFVKNDIRSNIALDEKTGRVVPYSVAPPSLLAFTLPHEMGHSYIYKANERVGAIMHKDESDKVTRDWIVRSRIGIGDIIPISHYAGKNEKETFAELVLAKRVNIKKIIDNYGNTIDMYSKFNDDVESGRLQGLKELLNIKRRK